MTNLVQFPGLGLSFEINRVAFSIGGFNIYWYGILIGTGMLLALLWAFHTAPKIGINVDRMIDVIFVGAVMAIICARAYYVAMAPFSYDSIWQMLDIRDGGLAIYGAVIGAFVFGGLACRWRKVPLLPMFDLTAVGFLIGQAVGRWGNFVNQEAFGTNTDAPWGMISQRTISYLAGVQQELAAQGVTVDPLSPVHPTFLYESLWCLVGFIALALYFKHRRFNGEVLLLYIVWYGLGRFWIEGLRTDSLYLVGSLRASQLLAGVSCILALIALVVLRGRHRDDPALGWVTPAAAEAPETPEATDTAETTGVAETNDAAETPETPETNGTEETTSAPGTEETTGADQKEEQHGAD